MLLRNNIACVKAFPMACVLCLILPFQVYAESGLLESLNPESFSFRARMSEKTTLGEDAPEDFDLHDVSLNFGLPWEHYSHSGWGAGTRLMTSLGLLRGPDKKALVLSLVPELVLGSDDGRVHFDMGAGVALFSRHRFGSQDYGGPFQFALTVGLGVPIYRDIGLAYRFLHYSDAAVNGPDTVGADLHMIEVNYWF